MAFWDFAVCWMIGFIFYGIYLPVLMGLARISRRVPPRGALAVARWLAMPCLLTVVTVFGLEWGAYRAFLSVLAYYVSCLIRQRRVQNGTRPSDRVLLQSLFFAAHAQELADEDEIELGERFGPNELPKGRYDRGQRGG